MYPTKKYFNKIPKNKSQNYRKKLQVNVENIEIFAQKVEMSEKIEIFGQKPKFRKKSKVFVKLRKKRNFW